VATLLQDLQTGGLGVIEVVLLMAGMVGVIAAIVYVERAQRKIPVQYARRVVGRRMYGGMQTHMPLRLNTGGVIPVIFASSVLAFPLTFMQWLGCRTSRGLANLYHQLDYTMPLHNLLYLLAIIFFCYFLQFSIIFNPMDVADNMKKYGGFIPGIRPGSATAEFLDQILNAPHVRRGDLPRPHRASPPGPDQRAQRAGSAVHRPHSGCMAAAAADAGARAEVLLRRDVAPDRGRRGHGHGAADRVAAHHEALRRLLEGGEIRGRRG